MGDSILGKTRWRRFGLAFLPGVSAVAVMLWLVATGVIAISLSISGVPFVLKASSLAGNGFIQYAKPDAVATALGNSVNPFMDLTVINNASAIGAETNVGSQYYAADTVTHFDTATISGLNQYVCIPPGHLPFGIGPGMLVDTQGTATATNLDAYAPGLLAGNASFNNMFIGQSLGGQFSQQADSATITNVTQIGLGTHAGTFNVAGLKVYAAFVDYCP